MTLIRETELEKFFERDIADFLDQKKIEFTENTDTKKLERALEDNDVTEARRIIQNAITKFNETEKENREKEIRFKKIQELIKIAQVYTDNTFVKNKLTQDLEILEKSGQIEQKNIEKITIFDEIEATQSKDVQLQKEKEIEEAGKIEQDVQNLTKLLFVAIRKKDLKQAIEIYRDLKFNFEKYPSRLSDKKKEIYNDIIFFYKTIQKIKEEQIINISIDKENGEKLYLDPIKRIIEDIKKELKNENYKEAKAKIINLKHMISLIPENYINIKSRLENVAGLLMQKVEFQKRIQKEN